MKENKVKAILTLISIPIVGSCAATQFKSERIDPIGASVGHEPIPEEILDDALRTTSFSLFNSHEGSNSSKTGSKSGDINSLRDQICDGKRPRITPSYNVHLVVPQLPNGTPLDEAVKMRSNFIKTARYYLQQYFYDLSSNEDGKESKYNLDYSVYLQAKRSGNSNQVFALPIPGVYSQSRKEVERYYSNLKVSLAAIEPIINDLPGQFIHPNINQVWKHFYSIIFPHEKSAVLVPRIFTVIGMGQYGSNQLQPELGLVDNDSFRRGAYFLHSGPVEIKGSPNPKYPNLPPNTSYSGAAAEVQFNDNSHLNERLNFTVSDFGWKIDGLRNEIWGHKELKTDVPFYPLHVATALTDLAFLKEAYAFVLPKEIICKLESHSNSSGEQATNCDNYDGTELNDWGYSDGKFSAADALARKDFIWSRMLASSTSLKEAGQPDGTILFETELDLAPFCKFGLPVSDLMSK